MRMNKLLVTLTMVLVTVLTAFGGQDQKLMNKEVQDMLTSVSTEKDFQDALELIESKFQEEFKSDSEIKTSLENLSQKYKVDLPKWTNQKVESTNTTSDPKSTKNSKSGDDKKETRSLMSLFIEGMIWGFLAIFTPCVFPMIPMTVSFFTKQSGTRAKGIANALFYGISIIVVYVLVGLLITLVSGSPNTVYVISTSAGLNLTFFLIFMVFAFSFLGAFEIRMPSKWVNKVDSKSDKGGLIGIFFMAFTLVLVSFSCTGPLIGSSLVQAVSSGSMGAPIAIMLGFSLALALPFMLFAIFPSMLNSLPQSGGWLNSVKVVLGLLEIALALKFLSMVDLAYHWDFLTREIFVAIWFCVFAIMGVYLLGKIRFAHDSPVENVSVTRFMFALSALVFAVYLLPGMWGAPLTMIDGIAPPRTHSEDKFRFVKGESEVPVDAANLDFFEEYRGEMHEVADGSILVFHDLEKGREYAKLVNKPVLVDFTGHSCANCRKTESTIWMDDKVRPTLQRDFVIISLYCDDRTEVPKSEQVYSDALKGTIRNIGNKWSAYQIEKYDQLSQPLYIVQDLDGNDLSAPRGYDSSIDGYVKFLKDGKAAFKEVMDSQEEEKE